MSDTKTVPVPPGATVGPPVYLDNDGNPIVPPKGYVIEHGPWEQYRRPAPGTPLDENGTPKLQQLVADPDFSKLTPAQQRKALAAATGDPSFNSLSDDQTTKFLSAASAGPWTQYQTQGGVPIPAGATIGDAAPQATGPYPSTGPTEGAVMRGPQPGIAGFLNRAESSLEGMVRDQPEGVKETMLSPERGVLHVAQGLVEGRPWRVAKGAMEAATLPSAFVAPEGAGKAGAAIEAGGEALSTAGSMATKGGRMRLADRNVVSVLRGVAEQAGLPELKAATAREAVSELAGRFQARAKEGYQAVDRAVGGELQPVLDKISDLKQAIKTQRALDPEKAATLAEQLIEVSQRKGQLIAQAANKGIDDAERVIAASDKAWAQFRTLEIVAQRLKTAAGQVKEGGILNPQKLATAVDALENKGKLVRAMGEDAAQGLKDVAAQALSRENLATNVKGVTKAVAKYSGLGLAGAGAYKLAKLFTGD